ncbi:MAG: hypothetical protein JST96_08895 [Bacteroidetes bacterium]|nr:hypothetical protein [Bacteroidota bacterium]
MCENTIFYTHIKNSNSTKKRFKDDRYENFTTAFYADSAAYPKELSKIYNWKMTAGLGEYFPQLDIQLGGRITDHSLFNVHEQ